MNAWTCAQSNSFSKVPLWHLNLNKDHLLSLWTFEYIGEMKDLWPFNVFEHLP